MSSYTPGVKSMADKNSLVSISDDDPIIQMIQAFGGADNKFSKAVMSGITNYEKEARSSLATDNEWSEVAPTLLLVLVLTVNPCLTPYKVVPRLNRSTWNLSTVVLIGVLAVVFVQWQIVVMHWLKSWIMPCPRSQND